MSMTRVCTARQSHGNPRSCERTSELLGLAEHREPLSDGRRLRFQAAPTTLSAIAQPVEAERHCCRFLRFSITIEPDNGAVLLQLSGPPGTGEFLAGLFDQ
jgi:hypothetical protein